MKIKNVFIMVLAFTVVSSFAGVGAVKAELNFGSLQGTWWVAQKQMDKGYVFLFPSTELLDAKAKRYTQKSKGYMYIPDESWDDENDTYVGIMAFDPDGAGGWMPAGVFDMIVLGGTPIDFAVYASVDMWPALRMVLTLRSTVKEDKKNLGTIKSGKFETLGSAVQNVIPPPPGLADVVFVGTRDLKGKYISEGKVPDEVKALVPIVP